MKQRTVNEEGDSMKRPILSRMMAILVVMTFVLSISFALPATADAASKAPAKPKILSSDVSGANISLKWKKVKSAKAYRVYVQTGEGDWKYWKSVKKNTKNKKKYSDKLKYKLKKSGKKYLVYKQANPYTVAAKKLKKTSYTFQGEYGKTYNFAIRSVKGKKLSKSYAAATLSIPALPVENGGQGSTPNPSVPGSPSDQNDQTGPNTPTDQNDNTDSTDPTNPIDPTDPSDPEQTKPKEYTIKYNLNGGENHPDNPVTYIEGTSLRFRNPTKENYKFQGWFTDSSFNNEIRSISPETKGNLVLYAKWYLETLNIQDEGMDDMIWSWWYYPQVVTDGTKTFWGYATKEGYCGIAQYDTATNATTRTELKKANTVDDHNGIALTLLKNKRIMCVYAGGHNADNEIHVRISDKPLDISSFKTDIVLDSIGKTCYGQIIENKGRYYLFYRVNNNSWAYRTTTDGVNWTDEVIMIKTDIQYYCKVMPTTDDSLLRILMYSNPTSTAPEIHMGFLNTNDGYIYDADAKTRVGTERLHYSSFQVVQEVEKGRTQRLLDATITDPDKPRFIIASFTPTKDTNDSVYYIHDQGSLHKICDGGNPIWDPKYQLGAAFIDKNTIASVRYQNGLDYVEIYDFDGNEVSLRKQIFKNRVVDSIRAARPIVDVDGKAFLWHFGYYNKSSYKDFDTAAMLYLIDKDVIIGAPENQTEPDISPDTEFSITYNMNDGENDPANPDKYKYGDSFEFAAPTKEGYYFKGWFLDSKFKQEIKVITPDTTGDLTLYAKWYPKETYITDADTSDMIWSWWTYPQVVREGNKTFWTYTTRESFCGVASYDESTGLVSKTSFGKVNTVSDTKGVALALMDDGRIMCVYPCGEDAKKEIHVCISDNPLDISSFTNTRIGSVYMTNFCQLIKSNGKYYIFYKANGNGSWAYISSSDGETWTKEKILIYEKSLQYYCRFTPTTDDNLIRIVMQSNVDSTAPEIRMGLFDTRNDSVYDADAVTSLGTDKVGYTSFAIMQDVEEGKTQRLMDVAVTAPDDPRFTFASFTCEKGLYDGVYYLYKDGSTYKICDEGKALLDPKFPLGASFAGPDTIVAARNSEGKDYIEMYSINRDKVSFESQVYSHDVQGVNRAGRPISDASGTSILWHEGKYNSAISFNTSAALYLVEKNIIITGRQDDSDEN